MAALLASKFLSTGPSRRTHISESSTVGVRQDLSLVLMKFCVENALSQGTDATGLTRRRLAMVAMSGKSVW